MRELNVGPLVAEAVGECCDGIGMFLQLAALMFSCFAGVRPLAVLVTVTVNINMLHAHGIKPGADPLCGCLRVVHMCVFPQAVWSVHQLDVWGQLKSRPGPYTNPPSPAVTVPALADTAEFRIPV